MRQYLRVGALLAFGVFVAFLLARWFVFYNAYPSDDKYDEFVGRQKGGKVCCGKLNLLERRAHKGAVLAMLVIDKDLRVRYNLPCSDSSYRVSSAASDSLVIFDPEDRLKNLISNVEFACWNIDGGLSVYIDDASGVYMYSYQFEVVPFNESDY